MFEFILCKIPFGLRVEVSPSYSVRYRVNTEKMRLFRHDSKIKSPDSVLYLYLCKQCAADFKVTWICCIGIESRFNWHVITNDRGYFANSLWKLHSCMTQKSLESKRQIMLVRHHYTLTIVSISALDDQTTSEGCFFAKDLTNNSCPDFSYLYFQDTGVPTERLLSHLSPNTALTSPSPTSIYLLQLDYQTSQPDYSTLPPW